MLRVCVQRLPRPAERRRVVGRRGALRRRVRGVRPCLPLVIGILACLLGLPHAVAEPYPVRWFFLQTNFAVEKNVARAVELVEQAGRAGLNGVIVGDGKLFTLEKYGLDAPGNKYRLHVLRFVEACRQNGIEIIPLVFGPSRARSILAYDPNLAAGYEVRGAVFEVRDGIGRLVADPVTAFLDGDFEDAEGDQLPGWSSQDRPGRATAPDRTVFRSGGQSVRLEPGGADQHGHCRLVQWVSVRPRRYYRVSVWCKTRGLTPANTLGIHVFGKLQTGELKSLTYNRFETPATQEWTRVDTVFNSLDCAEVRVHMGLWGGRSGQAWLDGAEITEIGLVNVLRRPGCPLTVTSEDGRIRYVEGRDFEPVFDPKLGQARWPGTYDRYHEPPVLHMRPEFPDGARLAVSFYHPMIIRESQVDCCLTEGKVFEILERALVRVDRLLGSPRRYMVGMDELRTGGGCLACKATGKTPGQLLGEYVGRCARLIRRIRPGAEVIVWHDMFDPNHNAVEDYYLVEGPVAGSWEWLDRDIIVCPWSIGRRESSLKFFASRGHRQIASVSLDAPGDTAANTRAWLESLDATPGVMGTVCVTWKADYDKVALYGQVVGAHERAVHPRVPAP